MRSTRGGRSRSLIAGLVLGLLLAGGAEAKTKKPPEWEPDPNSPVIKRITRQKNEFIREYLPSFFMGAGALLAVGLTYRGIAWILRAPCRHCGSRRVRALGRGKHAPRRCVACGHADANL